MILCFQLFRQPFAVLHALMTYIQICIIFASCRQSVYVYDVETNKVVACVRGHADDVNAVGHEFGLSASS